MIEIVIEPVRPDAKGNLNLTAEAAELHGDQIKTEAQGGQPNIGFWDRPDEWVSWKAKLDKPGTFRVRASVATIHADAEFVAEAAGQKLVGKPPRTGSWAEFRDVELGQLEIKQAGDCTVSVKARDAKTWKAINLRSVSLVRAQ